MGSWKHAGSPSATKRFVACMSDFPLVWAKLGSFYFSQVPYFPCRHSQNPRKQIQSEYQHARAVGCTTWPGLAFLKCNFYTKLSFQVTDRYFFGICCASWSPELCERLTGGIKVCVLEHVSSRHAWILVGLRVVMRFFHIMHAVLLLNGIRELVNLYRFSSALLLILVLFVSSSHKHKIRKMYYPSITLSCKFGMEVFIASDGSLLQPLFRVQFNQGQVLICMRNCSIFLCTSQHFLLGRISCEEVQDMSPWWELHPQG